MGIDFNYERSDQDIIDRATGKADEQTFHQILDTSVFPDWNEKKIPSGTYRLRYLPPREGPSKHWGIEVGVHYRLGDVQERHLCPRLMDKQKCPACERFFAAHQRKDEKEKSLWRATRRVLVRFIDMDEDHGMPKLWLSPKASLDDDLIGRCHVKTSGASMIRLDDPREGRGFCFTKEGDGLGTKYKSVELLDPSPLSTDEAYANQVLSLVKKHPLDSLLIKSTPEEIAAAMEGAGVTEEAAAGDAVSVSQEAFEQGEAGTPQSELQQQQEATGDLF